MSVKYLKSPSKTRKYNGKIYHYEGTYDDKPHAEFKKEKLKYAGYLARIVKDKHGYCVYTRYGNRGVLSKK